MSDWQPQVLVTITDVKGSAPRKVGASMTVFHNGEQTGTIGGGALEWQATGYALSLLADERENLRREKEIILGPDLEQCCGGVVQLSYELFVVAGKSQISERDVRRQAVALFGAGHIGKALVKTLADLEFNVDWIDSRTKIFPTFLPENVQARSVGDPAGVLEEFNDDTFVLVMTHCHKLDYAITRVALQSPHTSFVGLIGSATKKARFVKRLAEDGLTLDQISRLVCPIGVAGIRSKEPAAIAVSVIAQLLIEFDLVKTGKNTVLLRRNRA